MMKKKLIKNTTLLIILCLINIHIFSGCKKNEILDAVVTKPVVIASDHPVFSHDSGIYPPGTNVTITCTTPGATIRYTDDGTDPKTSGTAIEGPSPIIYNVSGINNHTVIKAFTYTVGMWDSDRFSALVVKTYTMEKAAAPVISHASQTFTASTAPTISITSLTVTAGFKYTIDGTDPKISGTAMTAPQPLSLDLLNDLTYRRNINLRIIAVAPGYNDSDEVTRTYIVQIDTPILTAPAAGTHNNDITVTSITCAAAGSSIYYTLDGSIPTTSSTLYSGSFTITNNSLANLRIIAFRSGSTPSTEVSRAYNLQVGALTVNPAALTQYNYFNLTTMTTLTTGASIVYTLDGSVPTLTPLNGTIWTGAAVPINVNGTNVRVIGFKANYLNSVQINRTYVLQVNLTTPAPASGTYNNDITITLNTTTSNPSAPDIYYRLDGVNPTIADTVYLAPFNITTSSQLRARGFLAGFTNSILISRNYTLQVANPTFSLATGTYNNNTSTTISTITTGATLFYTTDGSDPTHDGAGNPTGTTSTYVGAITIDKTMTVKAVGWRNNYNDSAIIPQIYTMVALDPTFAPAVGGPYGGPFSVTLNTGTLGSTILYTNDGSNPTHDGSGNPTGSTLVYGGAIPIAVTTVLRFMVYKTGYTSSNTVQITVTEAAGNFTVTSP